MDWPTLFIGMFIGIFITAYALRVEVRDRVNTALKNFFLGAVKGSGSKRPKVVDGGKESPKEKCLVCKKWDKRVDMTPAKLDNGRQVGWIHYSCQRNLEERKDTTSYREE